ncbi:MAG TPA: sulfatase-like hydrolase/transferase [Gemmatimonadales bacterium]|nr:sulfatase-like hydrolase/transferase [Gemmatimonadales bacterium]
MMRRLRLLYPFLFVVLPILTVLTRNPGGSTLADIAILIGVMLSACALAYAVVALVSGRGWASPVVPLVVLAGILWFYAYPALRSLYRLARDTPAPLVVTAVTVMALLLATAAAVRWLARRPQYLDRVTTFFALTGLLMVAWSGFRIAADQMAARKALRASHLARELAAPVLVNSAASPAVHGPRRDIYLIILDEYANSSVLQERFGFDNRQFEDSLRQLGFTIPRLIRSNYVHTLLSLPSLLNFSHLTQLGEELGDHNTDPTLPDYLMENNRTAAFLRAHDYEFLFFPSQWWISTQHNRNADWEFRTWSGFNPVREATRSDLRRAFLSTTPLALLHKNDAYDVDHLKRTLAAIEQVPSREKPTFALAHILNPHYPYVVDAGCHPLRTRPTGGWGQGRQDAYINQVRCLNTLLLRTVTTLLQRSAPAPIILLVGDHGTNSLRYSDAKSAEAVSPAQARERFGAFGAFFLPGNGARQLADSVTLVNVVPKVLNHYFEAGIQLAPDKLYMSLEQTPYLFVEVDQASLSHPQ